MSVVWLAVIVAVLIFLLLIVAPLCIVLCVVGSVRRKNARLKQELEKKLPH